jgi:benzoate membrane transport protein
MSSSSRLQSWLPALGAAIPAIILFVNVLSLVLTGAHALQLPQTETASWILVLYSLPGLLGLLLTIRYRQPLVLTGNVFMIIFVASLGDQMTYPELIGASILAGIGIALLGGLGLMGWLAAWIPAPIVMGLLAGAILPFVRNIFTSLGSDPVLVGGTVLAYLLSRRFLGTRLPAILPALIVGLIVAALTGQIGQVSTSLALPRPVVTAPVFSLRAIATATPVLVILIMLQANLPSVIFMQNQGYEPPERVINLLGGVGTVFGSLLGPTGISLALPPTALVAGPAAGEVPQRYRAAYVAGGALVVIGLLAGFAADLPTIIPLSLLLTLAGLSLVDVLTNALQQIMKGPLVLGPIFTFVISLSQISLFGFGPFFWSLVLGIGVSLLLEPDQFRQLREQPET